MLTLSRMDSTGAHHSECNTGRNCSAKEPILMPGLHCDSGHSSYYPVHPFGAWAMKCNVVYERYPDASIMSSLDSTVQYYVYR